ncbi:MAG: TIGR00282 family metallophosphoesterase [Selenomonadaceae bacterium]|nr:TIGR00282 family metallophosphoesterase [Selenomonadaceae bacterium]
MRIMMVGDIVGKCGRRVFAKYTKKLRKEKNLDMVVVNGENAAGGKGLTDATLAELYGQGADVVTSGNHIWDKKEVMQFIDREPFLLRPANYPEGAPGKGYCLFPWKAQNIAVINLSGRVFFDALDDPFQKINEILSKIKSEAQIIILDFHAEATSEKIAMGYYLDGKVSAVIGTHTHVQTADEQIFENGTAYITDVGMTGPKNSILGVKKEIIIEKFLTALPSRFEVAEGPGVYSAIIIEIDDATGFATKVERILIYEE